MLTVLSAPRFEADLWSLVCLSRSVISTVAHYSLCKALSVRAGRRREMREKKGGEETEGKGLRGSGRTYCHKVGSVQSLGQAGMFMGFLILIFFIF